MLNPITKEHRISFARTLRYVRRHYRSHHPDAPLKTPREFNQFCIIRTIRQENPDLHKSNVLPYLTALDNAR